MRAAARAAGDLGTRARAAWQRAAIFVGLRVADGARKAPMRELFDLAWPIAAAMLGETAMGLVDTKLVGALGASALGGVGMATVLMYLGYSLIFGIMRGVKVRTAYSVGQGRPHEAIRYAQAGVLLGGVLGALVWAASRDVTSLLRALRVEESTVPFARDFLAARTWGAPAGCALGALVQYRQGLGDARSPMAVALFANVVNATLAYALIHGHLGLPALGVRGAGYATAFAESLQLVALGTLVVREALRDARLREARGRAERAFPAREPGRRGRKKGADPGEGAGGALRRAAREVLGIGLPTGVHFALEMLAFTTFTMVLAGLGAAEIAAHHLALNTVRASFLPGVAIAEAASVLVARSLATQNVDGADRAARAAIALAVAFMTACGVVFALGGAGIARAFSQDHAVVAIARRLLLVAAVFQTLDAVNMALRGALRGAKDVRFVAVVGPCIVWCCVPGAALVLGRIAGLGALGGWCGFVLETAIGAMVLWRRWSRSPFRKAAAPRLRVAPGGRLATV